MIDEAADAPPIQDEPSRARCPIQPFLPGMPVRRSLRPTARDSSGGIMSDKIKIQVTKRTEFGKGASRQARRDGLIPLSLIHI